MGEYCKIANLTKKQYISQFEFDSNLTPWSTVITAPIVVLGCLLVKCRWTDDKILGSWYGDKIAIVSDERDEDLYEEICENYTDITEIVKQKIDEIGILDDFNS